MVEVFVDRHITIRNSPWRSHGSIPHAISPFSFVSADGLGRPPYRESVPFGRALPVARNVGFRGLSVGWSSVLFMGPISDIEHATAVAGSVCAGLDALRGSDFWKLADKDLLSLATTLERVGRLVYAAQVHLTGELDTRRVCERHAASSTAGLLRQTLCISPGDAAGRVRAARAILPRDLPSGGESPPVLPELRAAVDGGTVGAEQIRTVVSTMRGLPAGVDPELRELTQTSLTEHAKVTEPVVFARFARQVAQACDPDGSLDERDPVDKVELSLGSRNAATGLTGFKGFLDDLGVEIMSKAVDGLAAPRPASDGTADPRPPKVRRGQALIEALRRLLDVGSRPPRAASAHTSPSPWTWTLCAAGWVPRCWITAARSPPRRPGCWPATR